MTAAPSDTLDDFPSLDGSRTHAGRPLMGSMRDRPVRRRWPTGEFGGRVDVPGT